jgi:hypothetical protein
MFKNSWTYSLVRAHNLGRVENPAGNRGLRFRKNLRHSGQAQREPESSLDSRFAGMTVREHCMEPWRPLRLLAFKTLLPPSSSGCLPWYLR